jgi:nucleoid DNA-binding protein
MSKVNISDLASLIAEKHGMTRKNALRFTSSVVSVIQAGLENDRQVKVKGLGTFKVIEVDARESVNVNTGERLTIESHFKLTFLPDIAMKELVNRPFSAFDTVILNDGVDFSDISEEMVTETTDAGEEMIMEEEPVVEESSLVVEESSLVVEESSLVVEEKAPAIEEETPIIEEETPIIEEEATVSEEKTPVSEEKTPVNEEEAPVTNEKSVEEENEESVQAPLCDDDEVDIPKRKWIHWLVSTLGILVVACLAYWFFFLRDNSPQVNTQKPAEPTVVETPSDTAKVPEVAEEQPSEEPQPTAEEMPIWEKYDNMDRRLNLGAYYIVGEDYTIKARKDDTSLRIAKRIFGDEEACCYIEVMNSIGADDVLEAGTEVRIPKLKTKKSMRKYKQQ